ncbi:MAG: DNA/RNA nuclease SfsA [Hyphomicrobiaceae bacterium]|nr:DNA/RNA nuclease SfsA [Hyphomicrobiaceae bacterium]
MLFDPPLIRGRLIKRYKRFLADILLDNGSSVVAYCPNTGSMIGFTEPGIKVWLSVDNNKSRKHRYTWELVDYDYAEGPTTVGINTIHPNNLVKEAILNGKIEALKGYANLHREVRYGNERSRVDILLEDEAKGSCYIEVKNVHLSRKPGLAEFPDCVTKRGTKHLRELIAMVKKGHRAVILFLIQRNDISKISLSWDLDKDYCREFIKALENGVEALAYKCCVRPEQIKISSKVEISDVINYELGIYNNH